MTLTPNQADQLGALHSHLDALLPRPGRDTAGLLALAIDVALHGSDAQVRQLLALPNLAKAHWQDAEAHSKQAEPAQPAWQWPDADAPHQQLDRLLTGLLVRLRDPQRLPAVLPPGDAGHRMALRSRWLLDAADQWALQRQSPDPEQAPAGTTAQCPLKVLLWDPHTGQGQVGQLTLYRVAAPGCHLALVAAPASALTPCSASFQQAMATVTHYLRTQLHDPSALDIALAWDIATPDGLLWCLDGPSAGAALALGALWLLRDLLPPGDQRAALSRLHLNTLFDAHVTAALDAQGGLSPVGRVAEKAGALQAYCQDRGLSVKVHTAAGGRAGLASGQVLVQEHPDLASLVLAVARQSSTLTDKQDQLLRLLVQHDAQDDRPPQVPEALLDAVAHVEPVTTLAQYALQRWAWWARHLVGEVQNRFVPLQIVPDTAHLPAGVQLSRGPHSGLQQLLAENSGLPVPAFMLRGPPGAGKSTLLQHHEQILCRQALQDWHNGRPMAELPLYLPLSGLPHDEKPAEWALAFVNEHFGACPELRQLLSPAQRQPGAPQLRLMIDGLNELPTAPGQTRNERARAVLAGLRQALKPPLTMLLSARTHHVFDFNPVMDVAPVDLLPWQPDDIRHYIGRRFAPQDAERHWQSLARHPHVLRLCSIPFNLNGQCNLWAAKSDHLATDRADLYRRLLWQALVRELEKNPDQPHHPLRKDEALLTQADCEALLTPGALAQAELPPWPLQGSLLRSLFQQGLAQWRQAEAAEPDTPADARGEVEVAWDHPDDASLPDIDKERRSVAHWLQRTDADGRPDDSLRLRWREAVQSLGLLDDFASPSRSGGPDAGKARQRFKWRHQSWGEFLASVNLLTATPEAMPDADRQRLLAQLQAGRGFARSARDELAHQRQQVAQRWALPDKTFWPGLLNSGISLPRSQVQAWLRQHWGWQDADFVLRSGPPGGAAATSRWQIYLDVGALSDPPEAASCRANLGRWGDVTSVAEAIDARPGTWQNQPEGWQRLVCDGLFPPFRDEVWRLLGDEQAKALQAQPGLLQTRNRGDLDEVLGLALLGLDPQGLLGWLRWLLAQGLWPALAPVLPDLARRLEPDGPWPQAGQPACHPVLQHLRRLLLLYSVDAGQACLGRVATSGVLALLDAPLAGLAGDDPLQAHWQQERSAAFQQGGRDLRERLEAALLLGQLGDNLRYQAGPPPAPGQAAHPGLRLHPALWAAQGRPGQATRFGIGSSRQDKGAQGNEKPAFAHRFNYFELARLPVTVGEWQRFVQAGGYDDAQAPWWRAAGPAALAWLAGRLAQQPGQPVRPRGWDDLALNNPLQPVVGITAFEAQAYAAWAAPLYAVAPGAARDQPPLHLAVPCEAQWEAGVRGPAGGANFNPDQQPVWAYPAPGDAPGALDLNHANTRWGRPSPVGVFSNSLSDQGVADAQGNVWQWCSNALPGGAVQGYQGTGRQAALAAWDGLDADSPRALRGGGYYDSAGHCRPACRGHQPPGIGNNDFGLRLVRCVLPHSEP